MTQQEFEVAWRSACLDLLAACFKGQRIQRINKLAQRMDDLKNLAGLNGQEIKG